MHKLRDLYTALADALDGALPIEARWTAERCAPMP